MKSARQKLAEAHTAVRRARTRLLLTGTLAALKQYRREVVEHLDTTIARLEGLAAWCDGAELPPWAARYAALMTAANRPDPEDPRLENAAAIDAMTDEYWPGTVDVCDIALQALTILATGAECADWPEPPTVDQLAVAIAESLEDSNPGPHFMESVFGTFDHYLEAGGLKVPGWYRRLFERERLADAEVRS